MDIENIFIIGIKFVVYLLVRDVCIINIRNLFFNYNIYKVDVVVL